MIYLVTSLAVLALLHFAYESIVAPSLRLEIRYKLFALRDQARRLKMTAKDEFEDRHFDDLQHSINVLIRMMDHLDIGLIFRMKKAVNADPELSKRLEAKSKALDDCRVPEAQSIRKESVRLSVAALTVNSAIWFVYLIPVLIAIVCYSEVTKLLRSMLSISEPDVSKLALKRSTSTAAFS